MPHEVWRHVKANGLYITHYPILITAGSSHTEIPRKTRPIRDAAPQTCSKQKIKQQEPAGWDGMVNEILEQKENNVG